MKVIIAIAAAAVIAFGILFAVKLGGSKTPPAQAGAPSERSGAHEVETAATGPVRATGADAPSEPDDPTPPENDDRKPVHTEPYEFNDKYEHLDPSIKNNTATAKPMKAADQALRGGDFPVALERAEEALRIDPTKNRARVIAVLASCGLSDGKLAQRHANQLDPMRYERVVGKCKEQYGMALAAKPTAPPEVVRPTGSGTGSE